MAAIGKNVQNTTQMSKRTVNSLVVILFGRSLVVWHCVDFSSYKILLALHETPSNHIITTFRIESGVQTLRLIQAQSLRDHINCAQHVDLTSIWEDVTLSFASQSTDRRVDDTYDHVFRATLPTPVPIPVSPRFRRSSYQQPFHV